MNRWSFAVSCVQQSTGETRWPTQTHTLHEPTMSWNFLHDNSRFSSQINYDTYTHITFVWDYLGGPLPEETFTHSHPSWSSDILYQLPPSTAIHSILFVQFTSVTVLFHNLSPGRLWPSSWSDKLWHGQRYYYVSCINRNTILIKYVPRVTSFNEICAFNTTQYPIHRLRH